MDPLFIVGIALVVICGTYLVLTQLAARRRRQRERAFAALLDLAADALAAELNRSAQVKPPEGQDHPGMNRLGCECSSCEKARQAHEEQKRGGQ